MRTTRRIKKGDIVVLNRTTEYPRSVNPFRYGRLAKGITGKVIGFRRSLETLEVEFNGRGYLVEQSHVELLSPLELLALQAE